VQRLVSADSISPERLPGADLIDRDNNSNVAGERFDLYTVMQFMGLDYRIFFSK
jgi:hypothetical protein